MRNELRSSRPPGYPALGLGARLALTLVCVTVSGTILGGLLGLYEMHCGDATLARAGVTSNPGGAAVAGHEIRAAVRG